ncbi:MAG: NYN domain-containing protein [Rikenellaceae bacterium]|nr:NYN domain-containing protein [Rikenellaceae bacterium]
MKKCVIIVDNSNVWIEGKKFSAKQNGGCIGVGEKYADDPSWRIDFGKLLTVVAEGKEISHAILVGSRPPKNDSLWSAAEKMGYKVIVHDRNSVGKEKAVDTEIVIQGTIIICKQEPAVLKLVSGDSDFKPLISLANDNGWETEMWAFRNAFKRDGELAKSVSRIQVLDNVFSEIGHNEFVWPVKST